MKNLLLALVLLLATGASANTSTSDITRVDESSVVTQEQMQSLYNDLSNSDTSGANFVVPWPGRAGWYCEARSYWTGLWYYWLSYDFNYSRYMALNACIQQNGYTCQVACRLY